jgi:hypothetical protein
VAKVLSITRPWPIAAVATSNGIVTVANAISPNPREIAVVPSPAANRTIDLDLGQARDINALLIGYHTATAANGYVSNVSIGNNANYALNASPTGVTPGLNVVGNLIAPSTSTDPLATHALFTFNTINGQYVRITLASGAASFDVGIVAVGKSFVTAWGHEYGAGRPIEDTSGVERLKGGAFGIDEGVIIGGYQWTFGDLTDAELAELYILVRRLGISRSVFVVEDPDYTAGLNERIHWGLFDKLEAYERLVPGASRWNFKIRDWA